MASTVKAELDKANPNILPSAAQAALLGTGLGACVARTFSGTVGTVTANILTLPVGAKARQILRCFVCTTGAAGAGDKVVVAAEATPIAGQCSVTQSGDVEFAAADAALDVEVTYIPVEGELVTETIPVTAGGAGTFLQGKRATMLMTATLNAPGAAPGAKIIDDRGTASAAGHAALTVAGTGCVFNAADCTAACTADVTYYAVPGVGVAEDSFGERLEAAFDIG